MPSQATTDGGYRLAPLAEADRQPVIDILNHYIETSFAAFPRSKVPYQFFEPFLKVAETHPTAVARAGGGQVAGFGMLRPFHFADSFAATAEFSCFLHPDHTRQGLGGLILDHLCAQALARGIRTVVAQISSPNQASLDFHARHGFVQSGRLAGVGHKFDQDFDVIFMQKTLARA